MADVTPREGCKATRRADGDYTCQACRVSWSADDTELPECNPSETTRRPGPSGWCPVCGVGNDTMGLRHYSWCDHRTRNTQHR